MLTHGEKNVEGYESVSTFGHSTTFFARDSPSRMRLSMLISVITNVHPPALSVPSYLLFDFNPCFLVMFCILTYMPVLNTADMLPMELHGRPDF